MVAAQGLWYTRPKSPDAESALALVDPMRVAGATRAAHPVGAGGTSAATGILGRKVHQGG